MRIINQEGEINIFAEKLAEVQNLSEVIRSLGGKPSGISFVSEKFREERDKDGNLISKRPNGKVVFTGITNKVLEAHLAKMGKFRM